MCRKISSLWPLFAGQGHRWLLEYISSVISFMRFYDYDELVWVSGAILHVCKRTREITLGSEKGTVRNKGNSLRILELVLLHPFFVLSNFS